MEVIKFVKRAILQSPSKIHNVKIPNKIYILVKVSGVEGAKEKKGAFKKQSRPKVKGRKSDKIEIK